MSLLDQIDNEYVKRETITCEQCKHVNIISGKRLSKRKKKAHMVYCDDSTWYGLRSGCTSLGMNMGDFLGFLGSIWKQDHRKFSGITESTEGVNPRRPI
jgi:hypothetical protein